MTQKNSEPAKLISLLELFEGKKFKIPDYQRGYSWDEEQIIDLLTDIEMHNNKSGHKHFTGTIVVERPKGGDVFQIVDGQQRLVSCVMILRAIVELNPGNLKGIDSILTKTKNGFESTLTLNKQDSLFFKESILNENVKPINTASNERLRNGFEKIEKWLAEEGRDVEKVFNNLTEHVGFIFFETASNKETTTMFEVINNRGKELSELEKFHNYFLHLCNIHGFNALAKSINSAWDQILFYLEKADVNTVQKENQFVRNSCGVIFWDVWKNTDDLYKSFRAYISKNTQKKIDGSETPDENILSVDDLKEWLQAYYKFFLSASRTYAYLFNRRGFFKSSTEGYFSIELDEIFKKLRNHGSRDTVTPLVLTLMHHYYDQPKLRDKIVETVRITEILNFRLYCLPKIFFRADTKRAEMYSHAYSIYAKRNLDSDAKFTDEDTASSFNDNSYFKLLQKKLITYIEKYCPERKFVAALTIDKNEIEDFFSWRSLNFFLTKYEKFLRRMKEPEWDYETIMKDSEKTQKLTKEHILAVDNDDPFEEKDSLEKRRLGNMMLVDGSLNSCLGNKPIPYKIQIIKDKIPVKERLFHLREVIHLYERTEEGIFSKGRKTKNRRKEVIQSFFDARETKMIKFALEECSYPGEQRHVFKKVDTLQAEKDRRNERYYPDYDTF